MDSTSTPKQLSIKQLLAIIGLETSSSLYASIGQHLINESDNIPGIHQIVRIHATSTYNQSLGTSINLVTSMNDAIGSSLELTDFVTEIVRRFMAAINLSYDNPLYIAAFDSTFTNLFPPGFENTDGYSLSIVKLLQEWSKHVDKNVEYPEGTFSAQFAKEVVKPIQKQALPHAVATIPATSFNIGNAQASGPALTTSNVPSFTTPMSLQTLIQRGKVPDHEVIIINNAMDPVPGRELVIFDNAAGNFILPSYCMELGLL